AASPNDPDLIVLVGELNERLYRYPEAAKNYEAYVALLPARIRNSSDVAAMKVKFLRSFGGKSPATIDNEAAGGTHVVPFTLRDNRTIMTGSLNGRHVDFVLD